MALRDGKRSSAFDRVSAIGLTFAGVTLEMKYDGSPVLKAGGAFMAGVATDESAAADTLVVRCKIADRELFIEDAPDLYYITAFYERHPVVLVRLDVVQDDVLHELLSISREIALAKGARRAQVKRQAQR